MTWIVDFQVSRVVHSKSKGVLVWKDSRIKNSCIARYVCDMRRMSRAMYNILYVACYIRLDLFHKKTFFFLQAQAHAYRGTSTGTGTYNKYIVVLPRIQTGISKCYGTYLKHRLLPDKSCKYFRAYSWLSWTGLNLMNNLLPVGSCISSQVFYISGICSLTENCRKWISVTCKIILTSDHNPPRCELQKAWYSPQSELQKAQKISQVYKLNSQSQRQHRVQIMIIILVKQVWNVEARHDVCWYNQRHIYATLNTKWFFFFFSYSCYLTGNVWQAMCQIQYAVTWK
jgi:hypothetical protein